MIKRNAQGFTLIELSMVLVVIGLIVGGVLAGQHLISAAAIRAQITQIDRYNQAANTFYGKYGYLPGDIPAAPAAQFGFVARGSYAGEGDGNGVIDGVHNDAPNENGAVYQSAGEVLLFWEDLSQVSLIEGKFNLASATTPIYASQAAGNIPQYVPAAKIGRGNYINVWNGGYRAFTSAGGDQKNYFALSAIVNFSCGWCLVSGPGLTVQEAYAIDKKLDDGLPQSGNVQAMYINNAVEQYAVAWAAGGGADGANTASGASYRGPTTVATPGSATTCYDNGGVTGTMNYSITQNGGAGVNCALSFRMQAGD